eukprot:COSAG06_NODE_1959_length_7980_cov_19.961426_3_plen_87_part_00
MSEASGAGRTGRLRPVLATVSAAGRAQCALPTDVVRSDSTSYVRLTLIARSSTQQPRARWRARLARAASRAARAPRSIRAAADIRS